MKQQFTAIALAAVLAVPALALAQGSSTKNTSTTARKTATAAAPAIHATKGVVKSIDDSTLIVTKAAGKGPETRFSVNSSTVREGSIATGASVDVRYRVEGTSKIATAISAGAPSVTVSSSHLRKPGMGDSVENCFRFGRSRDRSSTTRLIRKLPNEMPRRPVCVLEIE